MTTTVHAHVDLDLDSPEIYMHVGLADLRDVKKSASRERFRTDTHTPGRSGPGDRVKTDVVCLRPLRSRHFQVCHITR